MPSVRSPLSCKNPVMKPIVGIVYAQDQRCPAPVQIPTVAHPTLDGAANPSFPSFEAILGADNRLHETWVTLEDGIGREHRFLIAAQYCPECDINRSLNGVLPGANWRGGLIVMRGGRRSFVVNMGSSSYKQLARAAVHRFLTEAGPLVAHAAANNLPVQIPVAYQM